MIKFQANWPIETPKMVLYVLVYLNWWYYIYWRPPFLTSDFLLWKRKNNQISNRFKMTLKLTIQHRVIFLLWLFLSHITAALVTLLFIVDHHYCCRCSVLLLMENLNYDVCAEIYRILIRYNLIGQSNKLNSI